MKNTSPSEIRPGLWHWQAPHPEWRPGEPWDPHVSSYAVDTGGNLLLFDPQGVPSDLLALVPDRKTIIILTCPWHERDSRRLVERFNVPVYTPLPDTTQDIMRKFNVSAERAGDGAPDLIWLLREKQGEAHPFKPGDHLPFGIDVFEGQWHNDTVLWIASHNAIICGDTLVDFGNGLEINLRWRPDAREQIANRLRHMLELPVEHLLATHGGPMDRATLERAIS